MTDYRIVIHGLNYRSLLRIYAHDDVSVGSWFIGADVKHVDERKFCCSSWSSGLFISLCLYQYILGQIESCSPMKYTV